MSTTNKKSVIKTASGKKLIVDSEDAPRVKELNWTTFADTRIDKNYARHKTVYLQNFVLGTDGNPKTGVRIRFKNGNGLDCRKSNLIILGEKQTQVATPTSKATKKARVFKKAAIKPSVKQTVKATSKKPAAVQKNKK